MEFSEYQNRNHNECVKAKFKRNTKLWKSQEIIFVFLDNETKTQRGTKNNCSQKKSEKRESFMSLISCSSKI